MLDEQIVNLYIQEYLFCIVWDKVELVDVMCFNGVNWWLRVVWICKFNECFCLVGLLVWLFCFLL